MRDLPFYATPDKATRQQGSRSATPTSKRQSQCDPGSRVRPRRFRGPDWHPCETRTPILRRRFLV